MEEACTSGTLQDTRRSLVKTKSNIYQFFQPHQTTNHTMSAVNSQNLSTALTVISANIEGLSASKASLLSEMCQRDRCRCLCLPETHRGADSFRPKIDGMSFVAESPHKKYGSAILIRDDLRVEKILLGHLELLNYLLL